MVNITWYNTKKAAKDTAANWRKRGYRAKMMTPTKGSNGKMRYPISVRDKPKKKGRK